MKKSQSMNSLVRTLALTAAASVIAITSAQAGGFAIREQSAVSQGASFAGSASQDNLSAMYWNPAGVTHVDGINTESHYSLILPDSELTANGGTLFGTGTSSTTEIDKAAVVPASYGNIQLTDKFYFGMSINSPFGLVTEPEDQNWDGARIGRTTDVLNIIGTPTFGMKIAPGIAIAGGLQIGYMDATLKFSTGSGVPVFLTTNGESAFFEGDDYAFGFTFGATIEPANGTKIGIGYRSSMTYNLEGKLDDNTAFGGVLAPTTAANRNLKASVELETPDIVTLSIHQNVTETARIMATVEWTNWSSFDFLNLKGLATGNSILNPFTAAPSVAGATVATIPADWDDGWFFSLGGELDINPALTVRAGAAYELSPIDAAEKRLTVVPDNDRIWVSGGFSYKVGQLIPLGNSTTTIDGAYTHVFIDDGAFNRASLSDATANLTGTAESSVDIISVSLRTKWGGAE